MEAHSALEQVRGACRASCLCREILPITMVTRGWALTARQSSGRMASPCSKRIQHRRCPCKCNNQAQRSSLAGSNCPGSGFTTKLGTLGGPCSEHMQPDRSQRVSGHCPWLARSGEDRVGGQNGGGELGGLDLGEGCRSESARGSLWAVEEFGWLREDIGKELGSLPCLQGSAQVLLGPYSHLQVGLVMTRPLLPS